MFLPLVLLNLACVIVFVVWLELVLGCVLQGEMTSFEGVLFAVSDEIPTYLGFMVSGGIVNTGC